MCRLDIELNHIVFSVICWYMFASYPCIGMLIIINIHYSLIKTDRDLCYIVKICANSPYMTRIMFLENVMYCDMQSTHAISRANLDGCA